MYDDKEYKKKYREKNKEKIKQYQKEYRERKKQEIKQQNSLYREKNKELIKKQRQEYYLKNKEKIKHYQLQNKEKISKRHKEYVKEYTQKNKEKVYKKVNEWRKNNKERIKRVSNEYLKKYRLIPKNKIDLSISSGIRASLANNSLLKNNTSWEEIVGYNLEQLMQHLEKKFVNGMSWDNYGFYWHIDHIKPKSWFAYESIDDVSFKECWSLDNLQPLESSLNIKKKNLFDCTREELLELLNEEIV